MKLRSFQNAPIKLRGYSGLEAQILNVFWNSIKKKNIFTIHFLPDFYWYFNNTQQKFQKKKFKKLQAGKVRGKKKGASGWHNSNPSSRLEKKRFFISKDVIIVPASERIKKKISQNGDYLKKSHFLPFFHSFEFFKNSKKQNFDINLIHLAIFEQDNL